MLASVKKFFLSIFAKQAKRQLSEHKEQLAKRYTSLNIALNSNIEVCTNLMQLADDQLCGPYPYDYTTLNISGIFTEELYGKVRTVLRTHEKMPDTGFDIELEFIPGSDSATLWITVDEFFPSTPEDWKEWLAKMTSPTTDVCDMQFAQQYYTTDVKTAVAEGAYPKYDIQHQAVFSHSVDNVSGIAQEFYRISVVNKNSVVISFGVALSLASLSVNY